MKRPTMNKIFPQALVWTALIVLCGAGLQAQDATTPTTAPAAPLASARSDGQIEMDVVRVLDASKALKQDLITAATIQGEVTLSGTVSSEASSELAGSLVSGVPGVTQVHNNLKVGNPQETQNAGTDANAQQMAQDAQPDQGSVSGAGQADGPMPPPSDVAAGQAGNQTIPPTAAPVRPRYAPQPPPYPTAAMNEGPKAPVTIPVGTLLQVRTNEPVGSKNAKEGTAVEFTVIHDVNFGGVLAIPRGATVHGVVTESKKAGALGGSPELALKLMSLDLGGQNYPLESDQFKVKGPNKAGQTVGNAFGGALLGAIIGGAAGRGAGAAIGAGAGAVAGTAASAASTGPGVWIPSEALVDFHLSKPLTVTPVNAQEAARLAQGLYPGGPRLYRRGYGPYGPVYAAYPPVYFHPYYMVGSYYYWR